MPKVTTDDDTLRGKYKKRGSKTERSHYFQQHGSKKNIETSQASHERRRNFLRIGQTSAILIQNGSSLSSCFEASRFGGHQKSSTKIGQKSRSRRCQRRCWIWYKKGLEAIDKRKNQRRQRRRRRR